jgi:hypothetical protein
VTMGRPPKDGVAAQADTDSVTIRQIMRSAAFAAGVGDVRTGAPIRFDNNFDDDWA